jgi:hypothetical protein
MSSATEHRTTPTQLPPNPVPGPAPQPATALDACLNFNLTDGRVVCLSVPIGLSEADSNFVTSLLQAHVSAVARRGR